MGDASEIREVTLEEVTEDNVHVLQNLYVLYRYELMRTMFDHAGCDLNEHGTFDEARTHDAACAWARAWAENSWRLQAFLIRCDGTLAGFAALARGPYAHPQVDVRINDFFVLNKFSRRSVGRRAACELFTRFPGRWELLWGESNARAIAFWTNVIEEHSGRKPAPWVVEEQGAVQGGVGLVFDTSSH